MQISCELFSSLPFPAIVADESGKVIYKNESARRYLPLVRCGAKIAHHIVDPDDVLCGKADFASFGEIEPYHRSFVLRKAVENDNFLSFLFFPTLQFGDTREAQQQIIESSAAELFGFTKFLPKERRTNRLYGDIDRFIAKIGNGLDDRVLTSKTSSARFPLISAAHSVRSDIQFMSKRTEALPQTVIAQYPRAAPCFS